MKSKVTPHEENKCYVCENSLKIWNQCNKTPDFQESPSLRFAQSEEPQPNMTPVRRTKESSHATDVTPKQPHNSNVRHTKIARSKLFTKITDNVLTQVKVPCGNESIAPSHFLDVEVASHFICALCIVNVFPQNPGSSACVSTSTAVNV